MYGVVSSPPALHPGPLGDWRGCRGRRKEQDSLGITLSFGLPWVSRVWQSEQIDLSNTPTSRRLSRICGRQFSDLQFFPKEAAYTVERSCPDSTGTGSLRDARRHNTRSEPYEKDGGAHILSTYESTACTCAGVVEITGVRLCKFAPAHVTQPVLLSQALVYAHLRVPHV